MKYNSIGEQLIAKAQELDPNYKPDKFNDMSEAIDVILKTTGGGESVSPTLYLVDVAQSVVRTTITEQEKINLEKGLYNQVVYTDFSSETPAEMYTPSKIFMYDGEILVANFDKLENVDGTNCFKTISFYSMGLGEKNAEGNIPFELVKMITIPLGGGGSSGEATQVIIRRH